MAKIHEEGNEADRSGETSRCSMRLSSIFSEIKGKADASFAFVKSEAVEELRRLREGFEYSSESVASDGQLLSVKYPRIDDVLCNCRSDCGKEENCCAERGCQCCLHTCTVSEQLDSSAADTANGQRRASLFECTPRCACYHDSCPNSTVSKGLATRVAVARTGSKGLGLETLESIEAGAFILSYEGEAISTVEAQRRLDAFDEQLQQGDDVMNYVFILRENVSGAYD